MHYLSVKNTLVVVGVLLSVAVSADPASSPQSVPGAGDAAVVASQPAAAQLDGIDLDALDQMFEASSIPLSDSGDDYVTTVVGGEGAEFKLVP